MIDLPEDYRLEWPVQPVLNETEQAAALDTRASAANKIADIVVKLGENATPEEVLEAAGIENDIQTEEIEDDMVDPEIPEPDDAEEADQ